MRCHGIVLALAAGALSCVAEARETPRSVSLEMREIEGRAPGAGGQVTLRERGERLVEVEIRVNGLPPGEVRAAEIHGSLRRGEPAACGTGAPLLYRLNHVRTDRRGRGESRTVLRLVDDSPIRGGSAYIDVRDGDLSQPDVDPGSGALCAEIPVSFPGGGLAR